MSKNTADPEERIILDGHDEDNISVSDDSEDDEDADEEGEMEMMDHELIKDMDPETRRKFENGDLSLEELEKMGIATFADDYGEEGELEQSYDGEEDSDQQGGEKKHKHDGNCNH